jgi:uncharacterized membrane protein
MSTNVATGLLLGIIVVMIGVGAYLYPSLPEQIAAHWDAAGSVNGYMPKFWGVFLFPIILIVLFGAYWVIPLLDPHHANIANFRRQYNIFWLCIFVFLAYLFALAMLWNYAGVQFNFTAALAPALALFYFVIGWLLPQTKQNWFVGIRTPWTLSSEHVWDKTHQLAGVLFKLAAIAPLIAFIFPGAGAVPVITLLVVPIVIAAVISVLYSFILYRQEQHLDR